MENEKRLPGPVILDVEPISCAMSMTCSLAAAKDQLRDSLSMKVQLAPGIELRTPDERSLNKAEWRLTFYDNGLGNELTEQHNAIGLINYYEEWHSEHYDIDDSPESCDAWANIDSPTFALLREMALSGRLPVSVRLHVHGIAYGWEPDGSGKVWDVKAHKNAIINKIELISSLLKSPEAQQSEDGVDPFWTEPVKESHELAALRGMSKAIERINANLLLVVGLLALIVAVSVFQ